MQVNVYIKENCSLCDDAKTILELLQTEFSFSIEEIDIYKNDSLLEKYHLLIPVIEIDHTIVDSGIIDYENIANFLKNKK
ncbi:glutaredoxin family protein [Gracilibacillus oryzae]|uniref:Glutaredoxin family protein n=1 Tax=Gracilibacillus oryzae TaxID=1672701 RepID=A0A7C8KYN4_9BACI|nr:glutaredoxin family protein [Gracilibacillus oryzae]KAB8132167.1 glutaredoxin family protein [Gracilibacillus oryzae]